MKINEFISTTFQCTGNEFLEKFQHSEEMMGNSIRTTYDFVVQFIIKKDKIVLLQFLTPLYLEFQLCQ